MKTNSEIVDVLTKAMSITKNDLRADYHAGISDYSENGLPAAVWDKREDIVDKSFKNSEDIETIGFKRGSWKVIVVLDSESRQLYIMMSQKNLDERRKEIQHNGFSGHYVYSLLSINKSVNAVKQLELLPNDDDYREKDCEKILGNYCKMVDEVIIASFEYEDVVASASLYLFDDHFNESEVLDISNLLISNDETLSKDAMGGNGNEKGNTKAPDEKNDGPLMVSLKDNVN